MDAEQFPEIDPDKRKIQEPGLPVEPDHDKTSRPGHGNAGKNQRGGGNRFELKVEQQEDHRQGQREDHHQALFRAHLIFIAAGKTVAHPGRDFQLAAAPLILQILLRLFHHLNFRIPSPLVKDHITGQESVFAFDHLRAALVVDRCQLHQGNLRPSRRRHQGTFQCLDRVTQLPLITHPHRIALPAFDRGGDRFPANRHFDHILHLLQADAVAGNRFAIDLDLQVGLADDPVGQHRRRFDGGQLLQQGLDPQSDRLDGLQVRSLDLDPHRSAHAALQHHDPGGDRLQLRRGSGAGNLTVFDDLIPDIIRAADPRPGAAPGIEIRIERRAPLAEGQAVWVWDQPPQIIAQKLAGDSIRRAVRRWKRVSGDITIEVIFIISMSEGLAAALGIADILRMVIDHRLDHRDRRGVDGGFRPPDLADHRLHLRNIAESGVLLLQHIQRLPNRSMGHGCRHVQKSAFIQRRHKFLPQSRELMRKRRNRSEGLHRPGQPAKEGGKPQPHQEAPKDYQPGEAQEDHFMIQHLVQDPPVIANKHPESKQEAADHQEHK